LRIESLANSFAQPVCVHLSFLKYYKNKACTKKVPILGNSKWWEIIGEKMGK
jgi:hypothetical protein